MFQERMNVKEQMKSSGFPKHEILCGLGPAIAEFLQQHPEWVLKVRTVPLYIHKY